MLGFLVPNCDLPQLALNQPRFKNLRSVQDPYLYTTLSFRRWNYHLLILRAGSEASHHVAHRQPGEALGNLKQNVETLGPQFFYDAAIIRASAEEAKLKMVEGGLKMGIPGCGGCANCCTLFAFSVLNDTKKMIHFDENPMRRPYVPLPSALEGDGP